MPKKRAAFYFDGFNLYHALDALRQQHLKWLSLRDLGNLLIPSRDEELCSVVYFTAYLTHRPDKLVRHRTYVAALEASGVECVLRRFKYSDVRCRNGGSDWRSYEEKETARFISRRFRTTSRKSADISGLSGTGHRLLVPQHHHYGELGSLARTTGSSAN
jgi:hypothetical protein